MSKVQRVLTRTRSEATRRCFSGITISDPCVDFAHHRSDVARLNHASFGAAPKPVLNVQQEWKQQWLEQPDEWYFSGQLHENLRQAAQAAATTLTPQPLKSDQVCLVENSTVAACAVAYHWSKLIEQTDVVIYFNIAYKACIHILQEYCHSGELVPINIPFQATSPQEIVNAVEQQLKRMADNGKHPKYAFLDHVSSQPAVLLPLEQIIKLVREYSHNDVQVCVDGAHAVGSVMNLDIITLDCDYYFSNLHKWAFAPPTATILWSPFFKEMRHPIVSWEWGQGLAEESLFPGTRDFSSFMAVPAAVEYLHNWRSAEGKTAQKDCHDKVVAAARKLERDWGTDTTAETVDESLVATQAMVRLPAELKVLDQPGHVASQRSVRDILREDFGVEASVGQFGDHGAYIRLSYAVYNTALDIQRLSDAIVDIVEKQ